MSDSRDGGATVIRARFPGTCPGCDGPIEVGHEVAPLPAGGWAPVDHHADAIRNEKDAPRVVRARLEGNCLGCGDPIEVGQEIAQVPARGWAHVDHLAAAMRIYYHAARRDLAVKRDRG